MSMTALRAYFKNRCEVLGYREHKEAFSTESLPLTIIDRSYMVEVGTFRVEQMSAGDIEMSCPATVKVFFKGFRDHAAGMDSAILESEKIIKECLRPSSRLTSQVKNVSLEGVSFEPMVDSNDNVILVNLNFSGIVFINLV